MAQETINVLVAFDAETIIKQYPNPSKDPAKPTPISNNHVYMTVRQSNAFAGQGGGELNVKANVEDFIEWRETTMSRGDKYIALLYAYKAGSSGTSPIDDVHHTTTDSVNAYLVSQAPDPEFKTDAITGHHWTAEVTHLTKGDRFAYTFSFELLEANPGGTSTLIGYYSWDPFITVEPR